MKQILHLILLILLSVSFLYAQSDSQKCPSISVEGPDHAPKAGEKVPFKVIIKNYFNHSNLKYAWSVSSGKILSGQGTPSIVVEGTDLENTSPTATIEIKGLPKGCMNILSETAPVCSCVTVILVNEYQKLTGVEENKKLDTLIAEMRNSPAAKGFIQKSFPSGQSKADVYQHLKRILDYLKIQDVDVNTITFGVVYGKNIEETRLYLIPPGADNPETEGEILQSKDLLEKIATTDTNAQANRHLSCPIISVKRVNEASIPDEVFAFNADISKDYDTSNLKYLWTVSAGKIVSGQGTLVITVDPQKSEVIIANLAIQGLPANCNNTASESYLCGDCYSPRMALLIYEYNRISFSEEKLRLNKFANEFKNYPNATVLITKSFSRNINKIVAYKNFQRIMSYLESRGISKELSFFGVIYGKEELTRLFIVPPDADQPKFDGEILDAEQLAQKLKKP